MTTTQNVRRITTSADSSDPDSRNYSRLGYVDNDGVYHFRDGSTLPTIGVTLVVGEDGTPSTVPTPDGERPEWSAQQRLHCVDAELQDAYDAGRIE
ncbi:hypothetical protein [Rhodococcoides kyotonense]|uniref:Uncharacterized protein n=1 Tax=Rhodococcoides kyotonense TaxID=398843 RepID=A0A239E685_9NOCA|nr:hypothetical protein [Rhodococcus kyotonensis]SNS39951.1 hypothetical protein SAMN05421642_102216 [Rhodococcus kyotonensis]